MPAAVRPPPPPTPPPPPELLSVADFCAQHALHASSVYRLIKAGAIQAVKIGRATRITAESAAAWRAALPTLPSRARR